MTLGSEEAAKVMAHLSEPEVESLAAHITRNSHPVACDAPPSAPPGHPQGVRVISETIKR